MADAAGSCAVDNHYFTGMGDTVSLLRVKRGANLVLSVEMAIALGWIARRWVESGLGEFVVTSAHDGPHREGSLHYSGNAFDIRTRHLLKNGKHNDDLIEFAKMLQQQQIGLRVVVHPDWVAGVCHLHIGYNPKGAEKLWDWTE